MRPLLASEGWEASLGREQPGKWSGGNLHPHWQIRPAVRTRPGAVSRPNLTHGLPD